MAGSSPRAGVRKYDLHVHTKYSMDAATEPERVVRAARRKGLGGVAITDHGTIKGGVVAKKLAAEDFIVVVGAEILTERGEVIGLFLEEEVRARGFHEVISEIRGQGGIVVVPHPFDEARRSSLRPSDGDARLLDCVEAFNSRCVRRKYNERAMAFATKHHLPPTAGSDAHFAWEIGNAFVLAEASDEEELRRRILRGETAIRGRMSNPLNHGFSKVLKAWRRKMGTGMGMRMRTRTGTRRKAV
ncbi:MAG: PHP domain-containing protein [Candidatus Alkanophagales archaeon]